LKIGLVDVDSHNFPNLCLMKLATYHQNKGDIVGWADTKEHYDIVYKAKVFDSTYTPDDTQEYDTDKLIKGGTGYDLTSRLPDKVESSFPSRELYGEQDKAYGFLTRGCPRHCKFCIVGDKEGLQSHTVANLTDFYKPGDKEIILLDPNLLACKDREKHLQALADSKASINFNQGLDIRFMNKDIAKLINNIKTKMIHFAWDNPNDSITENMLAKCRPLFEKSFRNLRVYVLTNFGSTEQEDLYRINTLRKLGYDPFVMIYDKPHASKRLRRMQRWVNNKFIFRVVDNFEDFLKSYKRG
jgi:hypothetical protein